MNAVVLLAAAIMTLVLPPGARAGSGWIEAAGGIEVRTLSGRADHADWPPFVMLVRLDPERHAVRVRKKASSPLQVDDCAKDSDVLAAINGGFFDSQGEPLGWLVADGRALSPVARRGWAAFAIVDGKPSILLPSEALAARGVTQAVQAGPRLVIEGAPNPSLKTQLARRSFIGIDSRGRLVLGTTGPLPADAKALARFLAAPEADGGAGLADALNLDGGSSTQLYVRGTEPVDKIIFPGVPVPDIIEVISRSPAP